MGIDAISAEQLCCSSAGGDHDVELVAPVHAGKASVPLGVRLGVVPPRVMFHPHTNSVEPPPVPWISLEKKSEPDVNHANVDAAQIDASVVSGVSSRGTTQRVPVDDD